uniref:Uncharacterized protein LOC102803864 n=1 Tax=Saccoglossus kowalevskii TaxID=10224 RepID=A0ABM0MP15_SACKO|nr:PREDICTED: uncharacterized protein LOC102803864 [Saccoglossus kowalevskii]
MKDAVDPHLRDEQAGFRSGRSCADQIATLRIILEQSLEWNSSLYVNFIDYEKAFDSVNRPTLWKLMKHYGIPHEITNLVRNSYEGLSCRVIHGGQLTDAFNVKTGQPIEAELLQKRWWWIGHTLRKRMPNITRQALTWNPRGKRKRGRPRNSWRRVMEADVKKMGRTWKELETLAQDRSAWRNLVDGLCPRRGDRRK